ncbi:MAG: alanine--tRNA ligase [Rikenellaceae bacterium]
MNSTKIRETFLEFFKSKEHAIVPSAPMVIKNDPTLMFTNAGMNQFKDLFLGNSPIVKSRVADTQKCLRVSGKHNDLDEVGHDTYHHTMFEMLGNWSFGDYFKKEAIEWAWELLVDIYGLDKDRIYATVFEGSKDDNVDFDNEAYDLWAKFLPKDHILNGNKKDNFWEMGETGPCGPCSEVHYDLRSDEERAQVDGATLVNKDNPLVIEIWNLVFMQFNRKANGSLEKLPKSHVDTGMGFERLCMIIQGKKSNYDTDVFQVLIQRLSELSSIPYGNDKMVDIAMRVISDHLRAIAFSIADGQIPSNVKAGYVIRRILRRAVRYGYTYLNFREPFMCKLVPRLVEQLGNQFPELKAQQVLIERVIEEEENSFLRTLSTGISLLETVIAKTKESGNSVIGGVEAFTLYDTYGFPIDLTELIARESDMTVNLEEFNVELNKQKERSRSAAAIEAGDWVEIIPITESIFVGYDFLEADIKIARTRKVTSKGKTFYQLVFTETPFYGNSGGQLGDKGYIESDSEKIQIVDTLKENNLTVHIVNTLPEDITADFKAVVDKKARTASENNHTATHLLQKALQEVLGDHVEQKGSMVSPDVLRFDFSHFQKVTPEEIHQVERLVNGYIRANSPLEENRQCTLEQAKEMGVMMLFGEKYGDVVRLVKFGESAELCGGTHAKATGQIGMFKIKSEGAISAGVRRIEAITGEVAFEMLISVEEMVTNIQRMINSPKIIPAIEKMMKESSELTKEMEVLNKNIAKQFAADIKKSLEEKDGYLWYIDNLNIKPERVKDTAFLLRAEIPNLVFIVGNEMDSKPSLIIALGDEVIAKGVAAGKVVKETSKIIKGGGGGQATLATAGGKDCSKLGEAIEKSREIIASALGVGC